MDNPSARHCINKQGGAHSIVYLPGGHRTLDMVPLSQGSPNGSSLPRSQQWLSKFPEQTICDQSQVGSVKNHHKASIPLFGAGGGRVLWWCSPPGQCQIFELLFHWANCSVPYSIMAKESLWFLSPDSRLIPKTKRDVATIILVTSYWLRQFWLTDLLQMPNLDGDWYHGQGLL